jgi:hypothetical protein
VARRKVAAPGEYVILVLVTLGEELLVSHSTVIQVSPARGSRICSGRSRDSQAVNASMPSPNRICQKCCSYDDYITLLVFRVLQLLWIPTSTEIRSSDPLPDSRIL